MHDKVLFENQDQKHVAIFLIVENSLLKKRDVKGSRDVFITRRC